MDRIPDSLAIALWISITCFALGIIAYICGISGELVFILVTLGILTGLAEWYMRRD